MRVIIAIINLGLSGGGGYANDGPLILGQERRIIKVHRWINSHTSVRARSANNDGLDSRSWCTHSSRPFGTHLSLTLTSTPFVSITS